MQACYGSDPTYQAQLKAQALCDQQGLSLSEENIGSGWSEFTCTSQGVQGAAPTGYCVRGC